MPGQSTQWIATARVLRRAGFGVTGPEVDAAVSQDWPAYVDAMLGANPDADPGAVATPMPALSRRAPPGKGATPGGPQRIQPAARPNNRACCRIGGCARMVAVRQPVHEKLTLLWHNHFATSAQKVRVRGAHGRAEPEAAHAVAGRFPHPGLRDADRRRDVALAGRAEQYRQGAQRKPRPRIHGAVRAGPRQRLHRRRRTRRRPRTDGVGDRRRRPDLDDPQTP